MGGKRVKGNTGKAKTGKEKPDKKVVGRRNLAAPPFDFLVWRFGRLDHTTQFTCLGLKQGDVRELEAELSILQGERISELLKKRWLKFIDRDEMTPAGQKALAEISQKQENGLWQLHLKRYKWRIWGYFDNPEFHFLWWDEDHGVATGKWRKRK